MDISNGATPKSVVPLPKLSVAYTSHPPVHSTSRTSATSRDDTSGNADDDKEELLHKYNCRFKSELLEKEFDTAHSRNNLKSQWICILAVTIFFGLILITDVLGGITKSTYTVRNFIFDSSQFGVFALSAAILYKPANCKEQCWRYRHSQRIVGATGFAAMIIMTVTKLILNDNGPYKDYQSTYTSLYFLVVYVPFRFSFLYATIMVFAIVVLQYVLDYIFYHSIYSWYKIFGFPLGLVACAVVVGYYSYYTEKRTRLHFLTRKILDFEQKKMNWSQKRDEAILQNIFPRELSEKLKDLKETKVGDSSDRLLVFDEYPSVSVIMVDIVGFTTLSSHMPPLQLVELLNTVFSMFDEITAHIGLEKIRTIGDAYLCVANMSTKVNSKISTSHQECALLAAISMMRTLPKLNELFAINPPLSLRVGIGSGAIVSGITGSTKWNYDIFGPTVMEAFRMEAMGSPGTITLSSNVVNAIPKGRYEFSYIGRSEGPDGHGIDTVDAYTLVALPDREEVVDLGIPNQVQATYPLNAALSGPSHILIGKKVSSLKLEQKVSMQRAESKKVSAMLANETLPDTAFEDYDETMHMLLQNKFYREVMNNITTAQKEASEASNAANAANFAHKATKSEETLNLRELGYDQQYHQRKDELEKEIAIFQKRRIRMLFANKALEMQFQGQKAKTTQQYIYKLTICLSICLFFYMVSDLLSAPQTPSEMPIAVWIVHLVLVGSSALTTLYIRSSLFIHKSSEFIMALMLILWSILNSLQMYLSTTIFHFYRPLIIFFVCYLYIRLSQAFLLCISAISGLTAIYLTYEYWPTQAVGADKLNNMLIYFIIFIICYIANYTLEKVMRTKFLALCVMQNDTQEMHRANRRAKLLLYNILPRQIAKRLGPKEPTIVDFFPSASVVFIYLDIGDLVHYPAMMFRTLNDMFIILDQCTRDHKLEKIKTINTSYMAVSGVPAVRTDHVSAIVKMVIDMFAKISAYHCPHMDPKTGMPFQIKFRAGVSMGPIVAGVIGKSKYAYDCWSDTANTASRMESNGLFSFLQVSEIAYEQVKGEFAFKKRGEMTIKGKGAMTTYLLDLSKPQW